MLQVSVIIPAYNEATYISRCLDALVAQTTRPAEIIVVDNGSTDDTAAIVQTFADVTLLHQPKRGTYYAREYGFAAATGDLLIRIDADTVLPTDWLERLMSYLAAWPTIDALTGRGVFYDVPFPRAIGWLQAILYQYVQYPALGTYTLWGAMMAVRRDAWLACRSNCHSRPDVDEDIDLSLALLAQGYTIVFLPNLTASASLRRNKVSPVESARYLLSWPKNYVVHRRYPAAVYIGALTLLTILGAWLLWPLTWVTHKNDVWLLPVQAEKE
jgi:glycosyltransferase involved in cell wall biosynthesis